MSQTPTHALPSYLNAEELGPWGNYLQQVDRVTPYLGSLARWVETLKRPKRSLIVDVPIELDNGSVAHFEGYRVQHNTSRGPGKGGVRFHQDVTLSEVMALAAWMSVSYTHLGLHRPDRRGRPPHLGQAAGALTPPVSAFHASHAFHVVPRHSRRLSRRHTPRRTDRRIRIPFLLSGFAMTRRV